jgi:hypothetical protein
MSDIDVDVDVYNTIQYNTIQYNTIQYNTIQYNTPQYTTHNRLFLLALGLVEVEGGGVRERER